MKVNIKLKDIKEFNKTKEGKKIFITAIVGLLCCGLSGFIVGILDCVTISETVSLFVDFITIILLIGGSFTLVYYAATVVNYVKNKKK